MARRLAHAVYNIATLNQFISDELHVSRVRGAEIVANAFETIAAFEPDKPFSAAKIAELARGMVDVIRHEPREDFGDQPIRIRRLGVDHDILDALDERTDTDGLAQSAE